MIYIVTIATIIFMYALINIILGKRFVDSETIERRLNKIKKIEGKKEYSFVDETMNKPFKERVLKPIMNKVSNFATKVLPMRGKDGNIKAKRQLEQAGLAISAEDFLAIQLVCMAAGGLAGVGYGVMVRDSIGKMLLYSVYGIVGVYGILRYGLTSKITARKAQMEKQLPDMLDLLSVSVEAGLAFERAMVHVTESMEGPLIDELTVTYREMSMGRTRKEALTLLAERCEIEELSSFTGAVVQAGQLGIPIRNVLRAQSEAIRRSRRSKVQEQAQKVSTKILIPMLIFIFPVLFIVLLGPSLISIMGTL